MDAARLDDFGGEGRMKYPAVRSEEETLREVIAGRSLARYGDGEFRLVSGSDCVSQVTGKELAAELALILKVPGECLVGIPRLDKRSPKITNWKKYERIYPQYLSEEKAYYSAFISRPDSAPWINMPSFYDGIESLWAGQEIALVYGTDRSLSADFPPMRSAAVVHSIKCARRDAYAQIGELTEAVIRTGAKRVILCCGATATCMAWRLAERGIHAIDLGHVGQYWRPYANPKSKVPAAA
jgi:hypothetical protein